MSLINCGEVPRLCRKQMGADRWSCVILINCGWMSMQCCVGDRVWDDRSAELAAMSWQQSGGDEQSKASEETGGRQRKQ
jgi:hypothetical protein